MTMYVFSIEKTVEFLPFLIHYLKIVFSGILLLPSVMSDFILSYLDFGIIATLLLPFALTVFICSIISRIIILWGEILFDNSFMKNLGRLLMFLLKVLLVAYLGQIVIMSPFVLYKLSVDESYYVVFIVQMILYVIVGLLLFVRYITKNNSPVFSEYEFEKPKDYLLDENETLPYIATNHSYECNPGEHYNTYKT